VKEKFNYYNFFRWIAIGFSIVGFGISIAIILALISGRKLS